MVSSHQILTLEMTGAYIIIVVHVTISVPVNIITSPPFLSSHSLSSVWFPACQFYPSKFDVTRPSDFHKVLKTSVLFSIKKNDKKESIIHDPVQQRHDKYNSFLRLSSSSFNSEQTHVVRMLILLLYV